MAIRDDPQLSACTLKFIPVNKRVAYLWAMGTILNVVYKYVPHNSSAYPPFLESLEIVLASALSSGFHVLLGELNAHIGSNSESWRSVIGKNGSIDLSRAVLYC